jgi:GTP-dependent phosphoenolpyruvate carboxykinase
VDVDGWKSAIHQIEEHFNQFGPKLPNQLTDHLKALASTL